MESLLVITHPDCAAHHPLPGHPERPERLAAALDGIDQLDDPVRVAAEPISAAALASVHSAAYLDKIDMIAARIDADGQVIELDADTRAGRGSIHAARLAAGATCRAVAESITGSHRKTFAVVRPPGHHAEADRAMGFCIYNSVAVAAQQALSMPGIARIAICDFDVHHGNGTEAIFAGREEVLFLSSHQLPLYPGTGDPGQKTAPNIFNAALPPGSGSNEFRDAWQRDLLPALDRFMPELVLVSAGFDAHWRDPLAQLDLKDEDYFWIGQQLKRLADQHAGGRLAASLEGGYDLKALTDCVLAFSEGITAEH